MTDYQLRNSSLAASRKGKTMTKKQAQQFDRLINRLNIGYEDLNALLKAERTLHRWSELECGDGNDYMSWSIERDEETDKPFRCVYPHKGESRRYPIPDREKATLKRVAAICERLGLHYYYQTDPRGCALYVSREPIVDNNYTNGVAVTL
jgi:hypothetical protein